MTTRQISNFTSWQTSDFTSWQISTWTHEKNSNSTTHQTSHLTIIRQTWPQENGQLGVLKDGAVQPGGCELIDQANWTLKAVVVTWWLDFLFNYSWPTCPVNIVIYQIPGFESELLNWGFTCVRFSNNALQSIITWKKEK